MFVSFLACFRASFCFFVFSLFFGTETSRFIGEPGIIGSGKFVAEARCIGAVDFVLVDGFAANANAANGKLELSVIIHCYIDLIIPQVVVVVQTALRVALIYGLLLNWCAKSLIPFCVIIQDLVTIRFYRSFFVVSCILNRIKIM